MPKRSAGILMWKRDGGLRVLLVHPGGPFWAKKDAAAWTIPKGEYLDGEDALAAARREFAEEMGKEPTGDFLSLGEIRQKGGKQVTCFAVEGDFDVNRLSSNTFEIEWPPRSGKKQVFPEVDRAAWLTPEEAKVKVLLAQREFIERLVARVSGE
ncbi:MAG: NUDIX domain-containing protein [Acidobacteriota bacterium]